MTSVLFNIMRNISTKPEPVKQPTFTENYLRAKKTLSKVMDKLTIQELQEIARHRPQAYIFFDTSLDALMGKMKPQDFQDFCQTLHNEQFRPF